VGWSIYTSVVLLSVASALARAGGEKLPTTQVVDGWILPAVGNGSNPIWGIEGGLCIGIHPTPGPRGLIRIYAPYLGQPIGRVINYIAVEPIAAGKRSLSEMENSASDGKRGKVIRVDAGPSMERSSDGTEIMRLRLAIERLDNGGQPNIELIFRKDHPHEVLFRISAAPNSARMDACILSATMGNYARLRRLVLKDQVAEAAKLWPGFGVRANGFEGFAPHRQWGLDRIVVRDNLAEVAAMSDEPDPAHAEYASDVARHWRYLGSPAVQTWKTAPVKDLVVRVNGRCVYWGSRSPIPGGVAFENFEMEAPFIDGQEFIFAVDPAAPPAASR